MDAGFDGATDTLPMDINHRCGFGGHYRWQDIRMLPGKRQDGLGGEQGWHQIRSLLQHEINRLIVEVDTMFDRGAPGQQRIFYALGSLCVSHTTLLLGMSLIDGGRDLLNRELGGGRGIGGREDSAARGQLDPIGPGAQDLAGSFAYLFSAIGHPIGNISKVNTKEANVSAAGVVAIAMPAGLANDGDRDLHAWSWDNALFDGHPDACRSPPGVAHRRDTSVEGSAHTRDHLEEAQRGRCDQGAYDVRVFHGKMDMRIDQTG